MNLGQRCRARNEWGRCTLGMKPKHRKHYLIPETGTIWEHDADPDFPAFHLTTCWCLEWR